MNELRATVRRLLEWYPPDEIIAELRGELYDRAKVMDNPRNKLRLENLARCLPVWVPDRQE